MSTKFTIALAITSGLAGGLASRYVGTTPVHAQAPAIPQEIRAQKFVLVDEAGVAQGAFGIETNGHPRLRLWTPRVTS